MTIFQRLVGIWRQRFPKKDASLPKDVQWAVAFVENASIATDKKELLTLIGDKIEHSPVTVSGTVLRASMLVVEVLMAICLTGLYGDPSALEPNTIEFVPLAIPAYVLFAVPAYVLYGILWTIRTLTMQGNIDIQDDRSPITAITAIRLLCIAVLGGAIHPSLWLALLPASLYYLCRKSSSKIPNKDLFSAWDKKTVIPPTFAHFREQYARAIEIKKDHMLAILDNLITKQHKKQNALGENMRRLQAHEQILKSNPGDKDREIKEEQKMVVCRKIEEMTHARQEIAAILEKTTEDREKIAGIYLFLEDYAREDGLMTALHETEEALKDVNELKSETTNTMIESLGKLSLDLRNMESTLLTLRNEDSLALPSGLSESILELEVQMMSIGTQSR